MEGAPTRTPAVGAEAASPGSGGGCGGRATRTLAVDAKAVSPQPRRRMPNQRHLHSDGGCRGRVAWILAVGCGGRATWTLAVGAEVVPPGLWRWVPNRRHSHSGGGRGRVARLWRWVWRSCHPDSGGGCGGRATWTLAVGAEPAPLALRRWEPKPRHSHSGGGSEAAPLTPWPSPTLPVGFSNTNGPFARPCEPQSADGPDLRRNCRWSQLRWISGGGGRPPRHSAGNQGRRQWIAR
jgi:hypothetical protein